MLHTFLRLTGLHEGHALIAPKLVGLLGLGGLICGCPEGLTILVIAMAVTGTVHLVRAAVGLATLAKLLTANLLRDLITQAPRRFPLGITLGIRTGCNDSPTFCLKPLILLLNHDLLISL
jgi:hypothetical protein